MIDLNALMRSCLDERYSYYREHYREPERFRISSEAHAAVVAFLENQSPPRLVGAEEESLGKPTKLGGPLMLAGVPAEIDDNLVGTAARAE